MNPQNPDELEAALATVPEQGANFFTPVHWPTMGPRFVRLWRAAIMWDKARRLREAADPPVGADLSDPQQFADAQKHLHRAQQANAFLIDALEALAS